MRAKTTKKDVDLDQLALAMEKAVKYFDQLVSKSRVSLSAHLRRAQHRDRATQNLFALYTDMARDQRSSAQAAWQTLMGSMEKMTPFEAVFAAYREMYRLRHPRCILSRRIQIEQTIAASQATIICGDYGIGKSSQMAQYLADRPEFAQKYARLLSPGPFSYSRPYLFAA